MTNTLSWVPRLSVSNNISVTPTISATAYTSGFQLGGIMTLTNATRYDSNTGIGTTYLMSTTIIDRSGTSPVVEIWFFNASPTLVSTNHVAFNIASANMANVVGAVSLGATYSTSAGTNGVSLDGNGLIKLMHTTSATSANLFAVAIVKSSVTFLSASDLTFIFGFSID